MNQSLAYELSAIMPMVIETGLLVSLFTAQAPDGNFGPTGAPSGEYADVPGLIGIRCTAPPESVSSIDAGETKAMAEIAASRPLHVLLEAWYPALYAGWRSGWRCVIDETQFDILGVESDSQKQMTRVLVRQVTT